MCHLHLMFSAGSWRSTVEGFRVSLSFHWQMCPWADVDLNWFHWLYLCLPVQERLTKQIALGISEALQPKGVAVVIEAV